jgi:hypothetical protein
MSRFENKINQYLKSTSAEFLKRLKSHGKKAIPQNAEESALLDKLQQIDNKIPLLANITISSPGHRDSR